MMNSGVQVACLEVASSETVVQRIHCALFLRAMLEKRGQYYAGPRRASAKLSLCSVFLRVRLEQLRLHRGPAQPPSIVLRLEL